MDKATQDVVHLMAINTTAGTASEITRFCIITDTARKVKMAIVDWRVTPKLAVNDPELMKGMPPSLTAATGMDAMTHAIEAYVSTDANVLTYAHAIASAQAKAMQTFDRFHDIVGAEQAPKQGTEKAAAN